MEGHWEHSDTIHTSPDPCGVPLHPQNKLQGTRAINVPFLRRKSVSPKSASSDRLAAPRAEVPQLAWPIPYSSRQLPTSLWVPGKGATSPLTL